MTIAPIDGRAGVDTGSETARGTACPSRGSAAFEKALSEQAGQVFGGSNLSSGSIVELASASESADNAWVNVMAVLEELQSLNLGQGKMKALLQQLSASYRQFQAQSLPIARLVESTQGRAE